MKCVPVAEHVESSRVTAAYPVMTVAGSLNDIPGRVLRPPTGVGSAPPAVPDAVDVSLAFVVELVPLEIGEPDATTVSLAFVVELVPLAMGEPLAIDVSLALVTATVPVTPDPTGTGSPSRRYCSWFAPSRRASTPASD